jgi:hypothetical protein
MVPVRTAVGSSTWDHLPVTRYELASNLARQLQLPELSTADADWIITASRRAVMHSEEDVAPIIGYLLGQANISPSNCDDQVNRAVEL